MKHKEMGFFLEAIKGNQKEIYQNLERLFGKRYLMEFISKEDGEMPVFKRGEDEVAFLKQTGEPREIMILVTKPDKTTHSQAIFYIEDVLFKEVEIIEWEESFDFDPTTASKEFLEWIREVEGFAKTEN